MENELGIDLTAIGGDVEDPSWAYRTEDGRLSCVGVTAAFSLVVLDLEGTLSARFRTSPAVVETGTTDGAGGFQLGCKDGRFCSLAEDDLVLGLGPRSSLAEFFMASRTAPCTF
jgi:hypothetical protein